MTNKVKGPVTFYGPLSVRINRVTVTLKMKATMCIFSALIVTG